ncbi:MAG: hypothetical protein JNK05_24955 [Myxococcales bacterium]|nr:hypothetical protein [Myxococcales bacterium]
MNSISAVSRASPLIRGMLNTVFSWRRELMSESLDRLVRQCDAKLPRVAPSLFERPLTEATWLVFATLELLGYARAAIAARNALAASLRTATSAG